MFSNASLITPNKGIYLSPRWVIIPDFCWLPIWRRNMSLSWPDLWKSCLPRHHIRAARTARPDMLKEIFVTCRCQTARAGHSAARIVVLTLGWLQFDSGEFISSLSTSKSVSKNLSTPCTISPSMSPTNINYSLTHVHKQFCDLSLQPYKPIYCKIYCNCSPGVLQYWLPL